MCFDSYTANINPLLQKAERAYTARDIQEFLIRVEEAFSLPLGILSKKREVSEDGVHPRPLRKYREHSLSEIRAAVVLYIDQNRKVTLAILKEGLHLSTRQACLKIREVGKIRFERNDEEFMSYYDVISGIELKV